MPPQPSDGLMGRPAGDATDQALRRWRPLARRDLSTARPARVAIRARNPCFLALRRELGWKVRFMAIPLGTSSRGSRHHEVCLSLRHPTDNFHRLTVPGRLHPPDFGASWGGQPRPDRLSDIQNGLPRPEFRRFWALAVGRSVRRVVVCVLVTSFLSSRHRRHTSQISAIHKSCYGHRLRWVPPVAESTGCG